MAVYLVSVQVFLVVFSSFFNVLALPKITVVLGLGVYCKTFQIDAAGNQLTAFPHQGKFIYNYVIGKQPGCKCNCGVIYLFIAQA